MKSVIIGIHGLGNKPEAALHRRWWLEAIQEGLARTGRERLSIPFETAYWADVIHPVPLDPEIQDRDDLLFIDEPYRPGGATGSGAPSPLLADLMRFLETQIDRIFIREDGSINFRSVTDKVIHHFFADLEAYFLEGRDEDKSTREVIQSRLADLLRRFRGYRIMLIAHSMGSIVAYDVLAGLNPPEGVHTLVTIGSPLGLPPIQVRNLSLREPPGFVGNKPPAPEGISDCWINMSDIRDKIALDHTLENDYRENSRGIKARDLYVYNDYVIGGRENPHKAYGYLRTPEMAEVIARFAAGGRSGFYRQFRRVIDRISRGLEIFMKSHSR